ncbi:hypothetical protein Glove_50g123 [Diversispora epigaea]|uniref:Uncharacterized protein n=1 Tax=Diversispora epigaea TaxID=1348612 RepID=A0A397JEL4_9GLOM|nr:hypothetical protein Glove_50g123 [Diversispora epigaea]
MEYFIFHIQTIKNKNFNQIELLTVYCYDDAIVERKEECSMKNIDKDIRILHNRVTPLVADWPKQLFVKKALTYLHKTNFQYSIPDEINSFIPTLEKYLQKNQNHEESTCFLIWLIMDGVKLEITLDIYVTLFRSSFYDEYIESIFQI